MLRNNSSLLSSNKMSTMLVMVVSVASASSALLTFLIMYRRHQVSMELLKDQLTKLRLEERRGRIRAEIRLRGTIKQCSTNQVVVQQNRKHEQRLLPRSKRNEIVGEEIISDDLEQDHTDNNNTSSDNKGLIVDDTAAVDDDDDDDDDRMNEEGIMVLKRIGTIVSPFTKRMGTPRQGSLAPHARGYVQFISNVCPTACLMGLDQYSHAWILFEFHANTNTPGSNNNRTKVRPPRGGGIKVGQLATRSPHRPNAIGLSLVKVVGIDMEKNLLKIAALDLVNGTPVYDIKPYVPWDAPGYHDPIKDLLIVPDWVAQDDTIPTVTFTSHAKEKLQQLVNQEFLAPLYCTNDGFSDALMAISEVLSQDPRSSKKRGTSGKSVYRMIFCSVQIEFIVYVDYISVVDVSHVDFETAETAEGLPLSTTGIMGSY